MYKAHFLLYTQKKWFLWAHLLVKFLFKYRLMSFCYSFLEAMLFQNNFFDLHFTFTNPCLSFLFVFVVVCLFLIGELNPLILRPVIISSCYFDFDSIRLCVCVGGGTFFDFCCCYGTTYFLCFLWCSYPSCVGNFPASILWNCWLCRYITVLFYVEISCFLNLWWLV